MYHFVKETVAVFRGKVDGNSQQLVFKAFKNFHHGIQLAIFGSWICIESSVAIVGSKSSIQNKSDLPLMVG